MRSLRVQSIWWRDLIKLSKGMGHNDGGFNSFISCRLGQDRDIFFWHGRWIGNIPLSTHFSTLCILSLNPNGSVYQMGDLGDRFLEMVLEVDPLFT